MVRTDLDMTMVATESEKVGSGGENRRQEREEVHGRNKESGEEQAGEKQVGS